jgi:hypothetical protein
MRLQFIIDFEQVPAAALLSKYGSIARNIRQAEP